VPPLLLPFLGGWFDLFDAEADRPVRVDALVDGLFHDSS
jgi:hypothetical protein